MAEPRLETEGGLSPPKSFQKNLLVYNNMIIIPINLIFSKKILELPTPPTIFEYDFYIKKMLKA